MFHFHRYRNFEFLETIILENSSGVVGYERIYEGRCEICGLAKIKKRKE